MKHTPESVRELIERLRGPLILELPEILSDSIATLSDLLAENERLREALAEWLGWEHQSEEMMPPEKRGAWMRARAALTPESKE